MRFAPELDLVVACCRWPPSPGRDIAVRAATVAAIDWNLFARVVARHRVHGLVHDGLRRAGVSSPPAVADALAASAAGIVRENLRFAAASARLTRALAAARKAGLQVGAVHVYNPCEPADAQAANFVTTVPRDAKLLPPAVQLDIDDKACRAPPDEAGLDTVDEEVKAEVTDAVDFAEASPAPELQDAYQDVYVQTDYPFIK